MDESSNQMTQELAADLTIAWLSNSNTRAQASDARDFLQAMFEAVSALAVEPASDITAADSAAAQGYTPVVSVRRSLASPEHIISLIDGKPYKLLRRHLSRHGLTPEEYRQRYGLKQDYPMVAPAYGDVRRAMAKKIGLGRKPRTDAPDVKAGPAKQAKPTRRGRKTTGDAD
jgi:predicted transcriptional regulator